MPVNLSQIQSLLLPGLRAITGKYPQIPTQWSKIFETAESDMALERTADMRYLPLAAVKSEGAATQFDNASGQRFIYNQEHNEIGLGYAITRKAIDDNLYKSSFQPSNLGLMESFAQTKEIYGANILNTGNVYNSAIGGDGKAMIASDHPIDGNTVANTPTTQLDLNEASLQSALIQIRQFRDNAGLKSFSRGRKLVVPIQLEYVAERLTKAELRPGTSDNDPNATMTTGGIPEGYVVLDFLTASFPWFVLTNTKGLLHLRRIPYETDMQVDFTTDNLLVKAYERYSFGYYNWRAIWGTYPTA
jgi:hypothetical protein